MAANARIAPASAGIAVRLAVSAFFADDEDLHLDTIGKLMRDSLSLSCRQNFVHWRSLAECEWRDDRSTDDLDLPKLLTALPPGPCRGIELLEAAAGSPLPASLRWVELQDHRGKPRASHLHLVFGVDATPENVFNLALTLLDLVPWSWGCAGLIFVREYGPTYASYKRMVRMAKRYWGIDVHDLGLIQNLAPSGILGINWLMMLGNAFCAKHGFDVTAALAPHGLTLTQQSCRYGTVVAAGPKPLLGDINAGEDLSAYGAMHHALLPLLLPPPEGLMGPDMPDDVVAAWSRRFVEPQSWRACRVDQI